MLRRHCIEMALISFALLPAGCATADRVVDEYAVWLGFREPAPVAVMPTPDPVYCFRSLGVVDCYDTARPYGLGNDAQPASRPIGNPPPAELAAPKESS